jgi:polyferredoxin
MLQEDIEFQKDGYHAEVIGEATPDILVSRFVSALTLFLWLLHIFLLIMILVLIFLLVFLINSAYVCCWVYVFFIANNLIGKKKEISKLNYFLRAAPNTVL